MYEMQRPGAHLNRNGGFARGLVLVPLRRLGASARLRVKIITWHGALRCHSAASALAFGVVGLFGLPGKRKGANGKVEWNWTRGKLGRFISA